MPAKYLNQSQTVLKSPPATVSTMTDATTATPSVQEMMDKWSVTSQRLDDALAQDRRRLFKRMTIIWSSTYPLMGPLAMTIEELASIDSRSIRVLQENDPECVRDLFDCAVGSRWEYTDVSLLAVSDVHDVAEIAAIAVHCKDSKMQQQALQLYERIADAYMDKIQRDMKEMGMCAVSAAITGLLGLGVGVWIGWYFL